MAFFNNYRPTVKQVMKVWQRHFDRLGLIKGFETLGHDPTDLPDMVAVFMLGRESVGKITDQEVKQLCLITDSQYDHTPPKQRIKKDLEVRPAAS